MKFKASKKAAIRKRSIMLYSRYLVKFDLYNEDGSIEYGIEYTYIDYPAAREHYKNALNSPNCEDVEFIDLESLM